MRVGDGDGGSHGGGEGNNGVVVWEAMERAWKAERKSVRKKSMWVNMGKRVKGVDRTCTYRFAGDLQTKMQTAGGARGRKRGS